MSNLSFSAIFVLFLQVKNSLFNAFFAVINIRFADSVFVPCSKNIVDLVQIVNKNFVHL